MTALFLGSSIARSQSIHFANGYALINGQVQPAPPAEFTADGTQIAGSYWIVQFSAPVQQNWLEQLARLGALPVGYLPHHAVIVRMTTGTLPDVQKLSSVTGMAPFHPIFKIERSLLESPENCQVAVRLFPAHNADSLARLVDGPEIRVTDVSGQTINLVTDSRGVRMLAHLSAVQWIQPVTDAAIANANVQWVIQTGWQAEVPPDSIGRRVWHKGIRGQGIILSLADTGVNTEHEMFFDPMVLIRDAGIYLHHRKIAAYKVFGRASFGSAGSYHGTQLSCVAAGNDIVNGGMNPNDGVAPEARICFLDVYDATGRRQVQDGDLPALCDSIYSGRGMNQHICQASLAWGWQNTTNGYDSHDADLDAVIWRWPDLLMICAAGNRSAVGPRIVHPAAAKNVLTVGACGNGIGADTAWPLQCRGPLRDGRIKPEVVAPGIDVVTAYGPGSTAYTISTGTSLATAAVNGACALIRQYLNEGWYPDGIPENSRQIANPSAALMRALAVISADPNVRRENRTVFVPDSFIGWGRVDLDSVLYFAGDQRRLLLWDDLSGLATGETREYSVTITESIPLRAVLVWTDTAGAPNAETALVNNLDLEVVAPGTPGQRYRGNKLYQGQSLQNPWGWDSVNTVECFCLNRPSTGSWRFLIHARNVFTQRQPYAFVVTGGWAAPGIAQSDLLISSPQFSCGPNPAKEELHIRFTLPEPGVVTLSLSDRSGRVLGTICREVRTRGAHSFSWRLTDQQGRRLPPGIYFLRLYTARQSLTSKIALTGGRR